tara:strand:+ start:1467 stop:1919 length:453 start_codon:yes stop_codon:yes gene_type:complete
MKEEFVIRGQTVQDSSGLGQEKLSFSGHKEGYAYKLVEFRIFPSTSLLSQSIEMCATLTAGKTAIDPDSPNFKDDALIGSVLMKNDNSQGNAGYQESIVNDTFLITQDLILAVKDTFATPVNWQCRFEAVKMTKSEAAVTNYKQFMISDE